MGIGKDRRGIGGRGEGVDYGSPRRHRHRCRARSMGPSPAARPAWRCLDFSQSRSAVARCFGSDFGPLLLKDQRSHKRRPLEQRPEPLFWQPSDPDHVQDLQHLYQHGDCGHPVLQWGAPQLTLEMLTTRPLSFGAPPLAIACKHSLGMKTTRLLQGCQPTDAQP